MEIKPLVLIVEDDKPICKFIKVSLETQNYRCVETDNGGTAISLIHSNFLLKLDCHDKIY